MNDPTLPSSPTPGEYETTTLKFPQRRGAGPVSPSTQTPSAPPPPPAEYPVARFGLPISDADKSAKYFSLELPSRFHFNSFKRLPVSQITGLQQAKFTRAANEKSTQYTIEAVSSALGDGITANYLTVQDYTYVMYWMLLASYTKRSFTTTSMCTDPEHHRKVKDKELDPRTLTSVHILSQTTLDERILNVEEVDDAFMKVNEALTPFGLIGSAPYMYDVLASDKLISEAEEFEATGRSVEGALNLTVDELTYLADLASYIMAKDGRDLSLADRIRLVSAMPADAITAIQEFRIPVSNYGITESINVKCTECGAEHRTQVSVSAHTFL